MTSPPVAVDDRIAAAARSGAWFAFSLSGGKDSAAASFAANAWLDELGHPRGHRLAIHADLGRAEWRSTPATVEATAARLALPLIVVRRRAGDMVVRWEQRFVSGKMRFEALSTYGLIGPWSSASAAKRAGRAPRRRCRKSTRAMQLPGTVTARRC